jgi:hypothetical protein
MLRVSINGGTPVPAESVVLYNSLSGQELVPLALAMDHGGVVFYADSVRDSSEFIAALGHLGIVPTKLPQSIGRLKDLALR